MSAFNLPDDVTRRQIEGESDEEQIDRREEIENEKADRQREEDVFNELTE